MGLFSRKTAVKPEADDAHNRELRRTMQNIVIAHAVICYKHMTTEQLEAAREEWAATVRGKGWAPFFADDDTPLPASSWVALPEQLAELELNGNVRPEPSKQS
jgi:hypothetical protein